MWRLGMVLNKESKTAGLHVLDLCAGCGVLGFELNFWLREKISSLTFVEVQKEYADHLQNNRRITQTEDKDVTVSNVNFRDLPSLENFRQAFDLIVCNPPYFREQTASLGKSTFRNRCHFLIEGSFAELCAAIFYSLAENGEAYVLLKDLTAQGVDQLAELRAHADENFTAEVMGIVRGTPVVRIRNLKSCSIPR
jgi:tRNA1(Val) A37 N6-methylase TrmN6